MHSQASQISSRQLLRRSFILVRASDIFLGLIRSFDGRDCYVRQLRDMKVSANIEDWDLDVLRAYTRRCAWTLARAHGCSGDAVVISGYMGSGAVFDGAVAEVAIEYSDENQRDHRALIRAVVEEWVKAVVES
jgi:uncharacterized protein DUF2252